MGGISTVLTVHLLHLLPRDLSTALPKYSTLLLLLESSAVLLRVSNLYNGQLKLSNEKGEIQCGTKWDLVSGSNFSFYRTPATYPQPDVQKKVFFPDRPFKNGIIDACSTADCCPLLTIWPRCFCRHAPMQISKIPSKWLALSFEVLNTALYVLIEPLVVV